MKTRATQSSGFTLIEMMVTVIIGVFLMLTAISLVTNEIRMLGVGNDVFEMTQTGRGSLDLLVQDIQNAGVGIGNLEDGSFGGLELGVGSGGALTRANGTLSLNVQNFSNKLKDADGKAYDPRTDDLVLRTADGFWATITWYNSGGGAQICAPVGGEGSIAGSDVVVLRSADGISSRTVEITQVLGLGPCLNEHACVGNPGNQCLNLLWVANSSFESAPGVGTVDFEGGTIHGNYREVVWYVVSDGERGELWRAEFPQNDADCIPAGGARGVRCGALVADNVEALHTRVYQMDDTLTPPAWVDRTNTLAPLEGRNRLRLDVELTIRARAAEAGHNPIYEQIRSTLEPGVCMPMASCPPMGAPLGKSPVRRHALRASVELKNAGRMHFIPR